MEAKIYNQKGEEAGKITLPESIFGLPWNGDLVHQVVTSMLANRRAATAHTKDRSEVRGGGKKPWQQKGTGRARHGSIRSPIWAGGGVTHGPRKEKSYKKKINQKMKMKALFTVLSAKLRDGELFFIDKITLSEIKTKKAAETLKAFGRIPGIGGTAVGGKKTVIQVVMPQKNEILLKSFRNIPSVYFSNLKDLNPADLLQYRVVVLADAKDSLDFLKAKHTNTSNPVRGRDGTQRFSASNGANKKTNIAND